MSAPGIETRQVLLVLGAACLVAALAAGTAIVWHGLGRTGQAGLMAAVTVAVLVLAVRLERLPATAQALGAVGVAGLLIDAVAGRSLGLAGLRTLPLHVYAGLAASAVAVALAGLSLAVPRLWAPPIGTAIAAMSATVAWVDPTTVDRAAWLGVAAAGVAIVVERLLVSAGPAAVVGRAIGAVSAIAIGGFGAAAALLAATQHSAGLWGGVGLVAVLLALPELSGASGADVATASSLGAGGLAGGLLVATTLQADGDARVALAGAAAGVAAVVGALPARGIADRLRTATMAASVVAAGLTYLLLSKHAASFAHVNAAFAVVSVAVAIGWRGRREAPVVRAVAAVAAVPLATAAVDIQLHLAQVTTPEAYVLVPAIGLLALGAAAMVVWSDTPSWALAPGLVFGLLPTVALALGDDGSRQAVALAAAATLLIVGARLRLAAPLSVGATVLSLVVLRLAGPEMTHVPEWVALGVTGIVLLALGATWEQRMLDARRALHAVRPRIASLR